MTHRPTRRRALPLVTAALAAALLAGCGGSGDGRATAAPVGAPAQGPHSAQDVAFLTDMLPHHLQAVDMADLALTRTTTPEVTALARQVRAAQGAETATMSGWLTGWGEPVPTGGTGGHDMGGHETSGHETGGHDMGGGTGMLSADELAALDGATGTAFARSWLTGMTRHHTGALAMAREELARGTNPEVRQLASSIVTSQSAEVATMRRLLAGLA